MNYFELFELPAAPSVDRLLLQAKYFELQKKNHPDFYTNAPENEKENYLEISADINKAFIIFKDPQKTIEYFLQSVGLITDNEKYNLPADFLMEMMEINETLTNEDKAATVKKISAYEAGLYDEVKPVINEYDSTAVSREELLKLKEYYYKKKYLNRILDRLAD